MTLGLSIKGRSKKEFYKNFISIGLPLIIQQFLSSSLNFVDNLMIGRLGTEYIAALGFANHVYKIQDLFLFGAYGGMGVFISQYHGKNNFQVIKKILGGMLVVGLIISTLFTFTGISFAENIIRIFTKDEKVFKIGVSYLKLSSLSYIVSALAFALGFTMRSIGKTKLPMMASAVGIIINTILNYCLIYGKFGFPMLAERGAAIATLIARIIQFGMMFYLVYIYDYGIKGKIKEYLGLSKELIREMVKVCTPIFFTEVFWILGTISLSVAYSRLGTAQAASVQIADVMFSLAAIIFMGVSNAASVMIGKSIGAGKKQLAILHSKRVLQLALFCSIFCVLLIQLLAKPVLYLYSLTPEVYGIALSTIRVFGGVIFFKLINWTILIGILRSGGDTKVAFCLDVIPLYVYAIPVAFFCVKLGMPVYIVLAIVNIEEVIKLILALKRYSSMRWLKDITV